MIPKHRGFLNLAYTTRNKRWDYDMTLSIFGKARLAATAQSSREYSDVFPRLNAQITYKLKRLDLYLGGENLTNYTQENPIVDQKIHLVQILMPQGHGGRLSDIMCILDCGFQLKIRKKMKIRLKEFRRYSFQLYYSFVQLI